VEIVRSVVFFGVSTFIELYWIRHLGASRGLAGTALACFLVGGVAGTLLGGRMADRIGLVRALQLGTVAMVPALVLLRLARTRASRWRPPGRRAWRPISRSRS
jgi:FSR family fosmidomycin resistance protein-like MFS transporter